MHKPHASRTTTLDDDTGGGAVYFDKALPLSLHTQKRRKKMKILASLRIIRTGLPRTVYYEEINKLFIMKRQHEN